MDRNSFLAGHPVTDMEVTDASAIKSGLGFAIPNGDIGGIILDFWKGLLKMSVQCLNEYPPEGPQQVGNVFY